MDSAQHTQTMMVIIHKMWRRSFSCSIMSRNSSLKQAEPSKMVAPFFRALDALHASALQLFRFWNHFLSIHISPFGHSPPEGIERCSSEVCTTKFKRQHFPNWAREKENGGMVTCLDIFYSSSYTLSKTQMPLAFTIERSSSAWMRHSLRPIASVTLCLCHSRQLSSFDFRKTR